MSHLIDGYEALRLLRALRFHIKHGSPDEKYFWDKLMRQLVRLTKKEYLVPNYIKPRAWDLLINQTNSLSK